MKSRILLLLLIVSSFTFAQTWNQVGATQFTDFASDGAMAFNNVGVPYIAYINPITNNVHVKSFNGTSWTDVGATAVSTVTAANVAITIRPLDNQPIVAFRGTANGAMYAYRRNGTIWTPVINNVNSGVNLSNHRLQIQTNVTGDIRVAGRRTDQRLMIVEETYGGVQTTYIENLIHTNNTYNGDHRYDFTNFDKYFLAWDDNFNGGAAGIKNVGAASYTWNFNISTQTFKNISGIADENYFAAFQDVYGSSVNRVNILNGTTVLKFENAANDIVKFRKSTTDNKLYLMYADDATEDLVFESYNTNSSNWSTLPVIGLNSGVANFFVKMEMNPVDGNMYVMYLDGGKASVKKYTVETPLNLPRVFVDANATGTGDGSSWADANTNLKNVLDNLSTSTTEIWVASGTYLPGTGRGDSFSFSQNDLQVYGGFNGTETTITQRDIASNPTILSGDINGDDAGVDFTTATRTDNSYHVTKITGDNVVLDGFKIENGHANGSSSNAYGGGLYISDTAQDVVLNNMEFNNNVGLTGGALRVYYNTNTSAKIENSTFNNNVSRYGSGLYFLVNNNRTVTLDITNCLFKNNTSKNQNTTNRGYTGSAAWIRANGSSSNLTSTITNCTFVNNTDIGTQASSVRGTLALSRGTTANSTHNATINNSIFYDNEGAGGTTTASVNQGHASLPTLTLVNNSIGEDSFSNLTYLTNTSDANPMFTSATDFTLQTGSPAIDSGDNFKIPAGITTDLIGATRIHNGTVDMGPYENVSQAQTMVALTVIIVGNGIVTPASGTAYSPGATATLIATDTAGWIFDGWSGDLTSSNNTENLTMDANKTVTATFIPCIVSFTDANFKSALLANASINTNSDTEIQCTEAIAYTGTIFVPNQSITSLDGIEAFVSATKLFAYNNQLTTANLASNTSLNQISISNNMLTSLTLSASMTSLGRIDVSNNPLTTLDVTSFAALIEINIGGTLIPSINFSMNANLGFIEALGSNLTSLDLSQNNNIGAVYLGGANVTSLDLRNGNLSNIGYIETDAAPNLTCIFVDDNTGSTINNWLLNANNNIVETNVECATLSVDDFEGETNEFKIYPNPTSNVLNIKMSQDFNIAQVYNIQGQKVLESNTKSMNVSKLSSGMYIIQVVAENGATQTKRFIKN